MKWRRCAVSGQAVATVVMAHPELTRVIVEGHTDSQGDDQHNKELSQRRAQAVASVLINSGVNPGRIRSIGRGEDQPIASNLTPEGRQLNRRVEIVITPNA